MDVVVGFGYCVVLVWFGVVLVFIVGVVFGCCVCGVDVLCGVWLVWYDVVCVCVGVGVVWLCWFVCYVVFVCDFVDDDDLGSGGVVFELDFYVGWCSGYFFDYYCLYDDGLLGILR